MPDRDEIEIRPTLVTRDGETIAVRPNANDAFAWLLRHQGQSVDYATTYAGYAFADPEPWTEDEKRHHGATASQCMFRHDHNASDRDPLTRVNCGACVLGGYEPRGARDDWDHPSVKDHGPNYAGWARIYVESRSPIPRAWRAAFVREITQDGDGTAVQEYVNLRYAEALARSIVTFGVRFKGK